MIGAASGGGGIYENTKVLVVYEYPPERLLVGGCLLGWRI